MSPVRDPAAPLIERYLDHVRSHEPVEATRLGDPGGASELPDLAPSALAARSRDLAVLAAEVDVVLADLPVHAGADREARDDLVLLADEVAYQRFVLDVRPRFVLDPLAALETIAAGLHDLLRGTDLPAHEQRDRVRAAAARARRVPVLLEQAGSLLASTPTAHLEIALARMPGLIALARDELPRRAADLGDDVTYARDAGEVAGEGLEAYAALLDELGGQPRAGWRLGSADHAVTLRSALGTAMPATEIEDRARVRIAEVRAELAELTAAGWSRRFPGQPVPDGADERIRRTLDAIADRALDRDGFIAEGRRAVDEARAFASERGLVDVPPARRLTVAEVPAGLRGLAVAFLASAPPLDPSGGATYYLSPVPDAGDGGRARSFLRAYHPAQLRSLALHEGYPGHFVQLEHAARHPRLARRLLARSVFAEGWAIHAEREAVAAGFGDGSSSEVDGDDYRITQRVHELRVAVSAAVDVGLHVGDLDEAGALELLTDSGFQGRTEARSELTRVQVAAGQLCSYFVGGEEVGDLRCEVQARQGSAFDLRDFHQRLLSHGTPTVDVLRRALADPGAEVRRPFAA